MTTRRARNETEVISASVAGRVGGGALLFGAAAYYLTIFTDPSTSTSRLISLVLSLTVVSAGVIALVFPWDRFNPRLTIILIPFILAVLGVGNYFDPMPRIDAVFFVLIGAWIGLCHPPFTTLAFTPLIALVYWAPIAARGGANDLGSATLIVTAVSVGIGELLGLLRARLERSRDELALSVQRRFSALTRNSIDVTFVFGREQNVRYVSPGAAKRLGYGSGELEAVPLRELLTEYVEGIFEEHVEAILDGSYLGESITKNHELRFLHADGTWIDVEATVQNLLDDPDIDGIVVHVRDIRDRKALENDLHYRAYHDELTGLANRAAFHREVQDARTDVDEATVVYLDLDGFKSVNDTLGHQQGDRLLRVASERLVAAAPSNAVVARLGGDEFAVLLHSGLEEATELAETFVSAISEPFALRGTVVNVGASAGVALVGSEGPDDQAIGDADMAMYHAKVSDSVAVSVYEPQMRDRLLQRLDAKSRLRDAIDQGQLILHYQPAVDMKTRAWLGAEALVRWNDPVRGLVPPVEFIGLAEETGLIVEMGRQIIHEACREAMTWPTVAGVEPKVGVNVSPRQFRDPDFLGIIESALSETGLAPDRLIVEITESIFISDIEMASQKLRDLRQMGTFLALDDFGTGYASLSYLRTLPFHLLKIDKSFVENAPTRARDLSLLQTINRLGHDLGLRTLVEGVETEAQAMLAASLHCDMAQGYVFAKPMSAARFRTAMADRQDIELPATTRGLRPKSVH